MTKNRGDVYIIERDERDIGGKLTTLATFYDEKTAYQAWETAEPDREHGVQLWLCRLNGGIYDPSHCDVLEFKDLDPDDLTPRNSCRDASRGWPSGRIQSLAESNTSGTRITPPNAAARRVGQT